MREQKGSGMRYVNGIPRKPLPEGVVLVHNHVVPQRRLRVNGFRAWTQTLTDSLELCPCDWAGVDLRGVKHYQVKGGGKKAMREQKGYVFRKGKSWFVRYCDNIVQPDGSIKRKLVCKKLSVSYCDEYRTKANVKPYAQEILAPVTGGMLNPQSTMSVVEFVDTVYLPQHVEKQLRAATLKQYRDVWQDHLKNRLGKLTLTKSLPYSPRRAAPRSNRSSDGPGTQFPQAHKGFPLWRIQAGKEAGDSRRHQSDDGHQHSPHTRARRHVCVQPARSHKDALCSHRAN
jgi:hypothetical protein